MSQCSVCSNKPTRQCNSCSGALFCIKCSYDHFDFHIEENSLCIFGKIQIALTNMKMARLKENIKQGIEVIKSQKIKILKETSKTIHHIKNMTNLAFDELEKMRKQYEDLDKKETFDEKEFCKVEEIINERLSFEYPFFGHVEGVLTKNSNAKKANNKRASMKMIESEFKLYLEGHTSCINTVIISNDNTLIASGSGLQSSYENTIRIWNLKDEQQISLLQGHTETVNSLAWTSDNQFIISGSNDKTIRIWNITKKRQRGSVLKGHESRVSSIAITNDNKFIVSGS